jgi:predicted Zn-dependent protease with MMP-like domain
MTRELSGEKRRIRDAERAVAAVLGALDPALQSRARAIPVRILARPDRAMRMDGIDPDSLGLFVGGDMINGCDCPLPPEILIFSENIWEDSDRDPGIFEEEAKRTYVHELGHYLGLNEDELWMRGLE